MSLTSCHVHFSPQSERVVYLSGSLLKSLQLAGKKTIHVKLGKETISAAVKPIERQGNHLYLSAGVRQMIRVPKAGSISLVQGSENEVQLGPLIGVLTESGLSSSDAPFGNRTGYIRQLVRMGEKKAYFFAFTPRDINWQQETINGYFLNSSIMAGTVKLCRCPTSSITGFRAAERKQQPSIMSLREKFLRQKSPILQLELLQ